MANGKAWQLGLGVTIGVIETYGPPPKSRAHPTNSKTTPTAAAKAITTKLKRERTIGIQTRLSYKA
jgi:hypothetical protein